MGAAKATLIVVGTLGGLGAVLAYSPPHKSLVLGGNLGGNLSGNKSSTPAPVQTPVQAPVQSQSPTPTAPTTPVAAAPTPTPTKAKPETKPVAKPVTKPVTKPVPAKKAAAPALINGTFNGSTASTAYGPVQVQIDVKNSKIVAARALQLPTSTPRDQEINAQAIPILVSETIAASSADIQGVSGASYTSQGWYDSLVSAIANAGL